VVSRRIRRAKATPVESGVAAPTENGMAKTETAPVTKDAAKDSAPAQGALEIRDSRTDKTYNVPVTTQGVEGDTFIKAMDLRPIKESAEEFGLLSYDPAFMNTASCKSAITFIDGDKGILRYRGYPIEQLAEGATFLEVAWLLRKGELPNAQEYGKFVHEVTTHTYVHKNIERFLEGFRYDAHPMSMLLSSVGALSSFYPQAHHIMDPEQRSIEIIRLIAKLPTIAAFILRHMRGLPFVYPDNDLSYTENFLSMCFRMTEPKYKASETFKKALDILFILHADHEQNASTSAVRAIGSTQVDPYSAIAGGIAALFGPLHGGANEQVLVMLNKIGTKSNVASFVADVKAGKGKLMGFGHRVYKNYDPRARIVKKLADDVLAETGSDEDLEIAMELEKIALSDEYFVSRKLYPNVDFYTGLIYRAMGFPTEYFTVLFAIARTAGWLSQWEEMLLDKDQKIARPRQIYIGPGERTYASKLKGR
jgi:citrate synthase